MRAKNILTILGLTLGLSACGGADLASRNNNPSGTLSIAAQVASGKRVMTSQYNVTAIDVTVPRSLKVSEGNRYYPLGDIVWRGEPRGDRYSQVQNIFIDAFGMGTSAMKAGPEVIVAAEVTRFHSLSEKARYTIGGVHNMEFTLTVRSAQTGYILDGPRAVVIAVDAAGGGAALAQEQAGRTQRVVVIEALRDGIRRELSKEVELETDTLTSRNTAIPLTASRLLQQSPLPL
ncbi:MAG: hypothetical protein ACJASV_001896 [Pseudorhodobacter sp.]|jgi:hypothetical protein